MSKTESYVTKTHLPCPCGSSSDAYTLYSDGHGYCFGQCGGKYFRNNQEENEYQDMPDKTPEEGVTFQTLGWRCVNPDTMKFFGIYTKVSAEGVPLSIAYPYGSPVDKKTGLAVETFKVRRLDSKEFYAVGLMSETTLFGKHKFQAGGKCITIFEGELDAASGWQILRSPCVSVRGASSAERDCKAEHDYLNSFDTIYICFDGDEVGQKASEKVAQLFHYDKVRLVKLTKYKDCNDFLVHGENTEFRNAWSNAKKFSPEGIINDRAEFFKIIDEDVKRVGIDYPFATLNALTEGLRTGEIVLMSALEGIGKTEVLRSIEYHLLRTTTQNIGIIHLEETKGRLIKGLAGYVLNHPVHLKHGAVSNDEIKTALDDLVQGDYSRLNVYSHFDTDDVDVILDRIRFLVSVCGCRTIFLDHIGLLVSALQDDDERRKLDYISTVLARMVKDLDFCLVLAAHVNAQGQIRGSTYPSKVAHLWVHLSRNLTAESAAERNLTYLTIKKNRYTGQTGPAGILEFNPETFKLNEIIHGELPT